MPGPREPASHLRAGRDAENFASKYLQHRGLRQVASNYRCLFGELDLVMLDGAELVVIEIRYRATGRPVEPEDTITAAKRRRIARATLHFMQRHGEWRDAPLRFDVFALSGAPAGPRVRWIRDAFAADPDGDGWPD